MNPLLKGLSELFAALTLLNTTLAAQNSVVVSVSTSTNAIVAPEIQNPEVPIDLIRAGSCESSYDGSASSTPQQFNKDGSPRIHWNKDGTYDIGAFQINSVHIAEGKRLHLDYESSYADNLLMALEIYKTQGIKAWHAYNPKTKDCAWNNRYYDRPL